MESGFNCFHFYLRRKHLDRVVCCASALISCSPAHLWHTPHSACRSKNTIGVYAPCQSVPNKPAWWGESFRARRNKTSCLLCSTHSGTLTWLNNFPVCISTFKMWHVVVCVSWHLTVWLVLEVDRTHTAALEVLSPFRPQPIPAVMDRHHRDYNNSHSHSHQTVSVALHIYSSPACFPDIWPLCCCKARAVPTAPPWDPNVNLRLNYTSTLVDIDRFIWPLTPSQ